jgi:regulator of cell morphogenesis and NO signaling
MEIHQMHTDTLNTTFTIAPEDTLNAIVAHYPQALPVLQRFGLDTCCGGALPLQVAAQHHSLDVEEVLRALHAAIHEDGR